MTLLLAGDVQHQMNRGMWRFQRSQAALSNRSVGFSQAASIFPSCHGSTCSFGGRSFGFGVSSQRKVCSQTQLIRPRWRFLGVDDRAPKLEELLPFLFESLSPCCFLGESLLFLSLSLMCVHPVKSAWRWSLVQNDSESKQRAGSC